MSRTARPIRARLGLLCVAALVGPVALAGCSDRDTRAGAEGGDGLVPVGSSTLAPSATASTNPTASATPSATPDPSYAVPAPGPMTGRLLTSDVLITGADTLPEAMVRRIRAVEGVDAALRLSLAASSIDGRTLTVAAVDPGRFRRFTGVEVAQADAIWDRLAGGEVAVDSSVSRRLISDGDTMRLGNGKDSPEVHVGAYAPLVKHIQAVVNVKRGAQLGLPVHNALLVSTGQLTPSALSDQLRAILGDRATMQILALEIDNTRQTAVLTGGSVSDAVGHFSYTNGPDGTIRPDRAWVDSYIRTEPVPLLGTVTCNRAMLPQLRAALTEVVQAGLSAAIHPREYAGCYYPRYIGRNPANGLSLHSWGIAVDLNVPGNQRGTAGQIDRRVVAIFKKWGFAWGGDWRYTDPMHFEMNAVVEAG